MFNFFNPVNNTAEWPVIFNNIINKWVQLVDGSLSWATWWAILRRNLLVKATNKHIKIVVLTPQSHLFFFISVQNYSRTHHLNQPFQYLWAYFVTSTRIANLEVWNMRDYIASIFNLVPQQSYRNGFCGWL